LSNIKGIIVLSSVISPLLIIGIVFVGFYIIASKDVSVFNLTGAAHKVTNNWVFSAVLYVSYNNILSTVILCGMLPYLKSRRISVWGGIIGGAMLCVTALIMNAAIYFFYPHSITTELPVLGILSNNSQALAKIYGVILALAMFISAVTSGYCLTERISSKLKTSYKMVALILCAIAIPMSSLGFSSLIATLYPVFGYLGLFLLIVIILQFFRLKISKRNV
jgi:uncharacterized membrane protein YkvI